MYRNGVVKIKIVLTGGGTSGHVTPNIALFEPLKKAGFELFYIGTETGIEKQLVTAEQIPFYAIHAGKLRRYLDMENIKDVGKILKGYREAIKILKEIRPNIVFSKGGFVSCPVVWAAKKLKIPVIIHESDITPGLANKLSLPCATKICYAFPETKAHLPQEKSIYTGLPVRQAVLEGNRSAGLSFCGFDGAKPVLTIIGGSLGSEYLNQIIRANLDALLAKFDLCHLCGKGHLDNELLNVKGYAQFEYVNQELPDVMNASDLFVSRAGATVIFELLSLKKPVLLIPLSKRASRGDQILNARSFEKSGYAKAMEEDELDGPKLLQAIDELYQNRDTFLENQRNANTIKSVSAVVNVILSTAKGTA